MSEADPDDWFTPPSPERFPTLIAIAVMVMRAPLEKLRSDRFAVPLKMFHDGMVEWHDWCRENKRQALVGDIDQQNFIWRGIPIVADMAAA